MEAERGAETELAFYEFILGILCKECMKNHARI
jgi:hypothetical protein